MEIDVDFLDFFPPPRIINKGNIEKMTGETVPYVIELGLSKVSIDECKGWKAFINKFIVEFVDKNPSIMDYKTVLQNKIMLEDYQWNWPKKALFYNTTEYNWFFLKTFDGVQGVCLTFHPKKSVFNGVDIFYIKYLSSAPWNRISSLYERIYKGIGREIVRQIQIYFKKRFHYEYGFSLHSLPQAQKFYENIGMINVPEYNDKDGLLFYEMNKDNVLLLLGETNA